MAVTFDPNTATYYPASYTGQVAPPPPPEVAQSSEAPPPPPPEQTTQSSPPPPPPDPEVGTTLDTVV